MMRAVLPWPVLTLVLATLWVMLSGGYSPGTIVTGLVLGVVIARLTAARLPHHPRLRNPLMIAEFCAVVLWDIVLANVAVAGIILFRRNAALCPAWITIPVTLHSPEAITVLAATITLTPGTVTADLAADRRSLLVHSLHAPDPDAVRAAILHRYQRRLIRLFAEDGAP